jgi:acetyl-CoA carboxylase biotin carboxyl carrier protein
MSRIRTLVKILEESNIEELEVSGWWHRVRIRKKLTPLKYGKDSPSKLETVIESKNTIKKQELIEIKSPMVGTFYRAPAPDEKYYVEVGDLIKENKIIYRIEAMKLNNEIKSGYAGKIVEVLVENAKPIEFGQPLFLIEPAN